MVAQILVIASVLGVINMANGLSAPFITPCKISDGKCARDNSLIAIPKFADGLPEYGVKRMDPLVFDRVDASTPNLKFILSDITLAGLKSCQPNIVQRNAAKSNIQLQVECLVNLDGDYEMSGQILLLKIAGKGKIHALLRKLVLDIVADITEKEKNGEKYFRIKKFTHSFDLKDKSDLSFEGLFEDSDVLTPILKKCKSEDSKCLKEVSQHLIPKFTAGIPELGVEKLDPFSMKTLDASSAGLKLNIWDITGTGLKDCVAKKVQRDVEKSLLTVKLQCNVDFAGKYEMNGQILLLPIEGKGDAHVVLRKLNILAEVDIGDNIGKDGQKHWTIKNWRHSYDLKDKSTLELENLFNGNEVLGRVARELFATSSNEIVREVGPPIIKAVVAKIIDNVENFFQHVPASELSLD